MTDSTPTSSSGTGAADDSRFTVEDDGSTTDPADLAQDRAADRPTGRAALDDDPGHVFDQTNGVVDGLDGDSDGTAGSDEESRAERADEDSVLDGRDGLVVDRDDR